MTVFSSVDSAVRAGFRWLEFSPEYRLHVMETEFCTRNGRVRALAFAEPSADPDSATDAS